MPEVGPVVGDGEQPLKQTAVIPALVAGIHGEARAMPQKRYAVVADFDRCPR
jgi:hypothetical protein